MLFNSGQFFFFFIAVYALYLVLPHRRQNNLLLLASYYFYAAWNFYFLSLIILSTLVDYWAARWITHAKVNKRQTQARLWLWLSLLTNLSILGFFKYFNFFSENFVVLLNGFGLSVSPLTLQIILPVGISFYTFQSMSYTIDVYRGRQKVVYSLQLFALYVAFFPQLMAGPIERAKKLLPQLDKPRQPCAEKIREGAWLILWGLFKKVYIADNLAPYVEWAFALEGAATAIDVYIGIWAFSIQLYCDFSGYSDMARGLARLLGVDLSRNFNLPYWASNPAELWQRWHITLSNWFRDYVYGPLREHLPNKIWYPLALLPTMVLVGLWHGAAWKYIVFGFLWGITLLAHRVLWQPWFKSIKPAQNSVWLRTASVLFTYHLWLFYLLFFIAMDVTHGWQLWTTLFTQFTIPAHAAKDALSVAFYLAPLLLMQILQFSWQRNDVITLVPVWGRIMLYVLLLGLLMLNGAEHLTQFIYFQF